MRRRGVRERGEVFFSNAKVWCFCRHFSPQWLIVAWRVKSVHFLNAELKLHLLHPCRDTDEENTGIGLKWLGTGS